MHVSKFSLCSLSPVSLYVPSYWTPTEAVVARLPSSLRSTVLANVTVYFTKVLKCDMARHPDYHGRYFVTLLRSSKEICRLRPDNMKSVEPTFSFNEGPVHTDADRDQWNEYKEYLLDAKNVANLSLCTPANFVPVDEKTRRVLQESNSWLLRTKWDLRTIFGFYPGLFELVREKDFVRVRSKVSDFITTEPYCTPALWTKFIETLLQRADGNTVEHLEATFSPEERTLVERLFPHEGVSGVIAAHEYYIRKTRQGVLNLQLPKKRGPILGIYMRETKLENRVTDQAHWDAILANAQCISGLITHEKKSKLRQKSERLRSLRKEVGLVTQDELEKIAQRLFSALVCEKKEVTIHQIPRYLVGGDVDRIKAKLGILRFLQRFPKQFGIRRNDYQEVFVRAIHPELPSDNESEQSTPAPNETCGGQKMDTDVIVSKVLKVVKNETHRRPRTLTALGNILDEESKKYIRRKFRNIRKFILAYPQCFHIVVIKNTEYVQSRRGD